MVTPTGGSDKEPGSFRDPSGFVFRRAGVVLRAVSESYRASYELLMNSGLHRALSDAGLLIPHEEVETPPDIDAGVFRTIRPRLVPFISYPYEWCFSALKDAARLTVAIQRRAMEFGMSLKDASAYNIQFLDGKPIFIDTLSFEPYQEGKPWVAYQQFCRQFLAPLALMSHADVRLNQLLRIHIDGIPLDLASRLLPGSTRLSLTLGPHIHLHAKSQQHYAARVLKPTERRLSRMAFAGLLGGLEAAVNSQGWKPAKTEWAGYYDETNYSPAAFAEKARLVGEYLERVHPSTAWDLGANTGHFSRTAAVRGIKTVAFDSDPAAVEQGYLQARERGEKNVIYLLQDLANPSPGIGWQNHERLSLLERGPADVVLALALIHHLAIGNNLPLGRIAEFMARAGRSLIVEFVPKDDSQVQRLLATREDIFPGYRQTDFESEFAEYFEIDQRARIGDSARTLYLMKRRGGL